MQHWYSGAKMDLSSWNGFPKLEKNISNANQYSAKILDAKRLIFSNWA